jgi:hypothetical protein
MTNALYIASCLLVSLLMYILKINNKTRYSNTWIKPKQYNKLQRYLKQWRIMLAHLNKYIDIYFKTNYGVSAYHIKTKFHSNQLTRKPYGHKRRQRAHTARTQCLKHRAQNVDPVDRLSMQSTTPTPHRVHFDSDSYDIFVDNCCSKSITNCLDEHSAMALAG